MTETERRLRALVAEVDPEGLAQIEITGWYVTSPRDAAWWEPCEATVTWGDGTRTIMRCSRGEWAYYLREESCTG